jgi:hypothetical protein
VGDHPVRVVNDTQYAIEVFIDLVVPEPQYPEPLCDEVSIAFAVPARMRIESVLPAINFDHETLLQADEIHDEIITRRLPAEMEAALSP